MRATMTDAKQKQLQGLQEAHERAVRRAEQENRAYLLAKKENSVREKNVINRLEYLETEVQKLKELIK
jgi:hypothetical protein